MVFNFTNMDGFIYIFRSLGQNAQEKTDEYGIMFQCHILKLVILIPDAAAQPSLHMLWPENRREQCMWRESPMLTLGATLVSASSS